MSDVEYQFKLESRIKKLYADYLRNHRRPLPSEEPTITKDYKQGNRTSTIDRLEKSTRYLKKTLNLTEYKLCCDQVEKNLCYFRNDIDDVDCNALSKRHGESAKVRCVTNKENDENESKIKGYFLFYFMRGLVGNSYIHSTDYSKYRNIIDIIHKKVSDYVKKINTDVGGDENDFNHWFVVLHFFHETVGDNDDDLHYHPYRSMGILHDDCKKFENGLQVRDWKSRVANIYKDQIKKIGSN